MTPRVEIILLAAGRSSRMEGKDKTLETVSGQPLLRQMVETCLASEARKTHVVLSPDHPKRFKAIEDLGADVVEAHDAHLGMSASLKGGLKSARSADAVMIVLADMPEITVEHINALIAAYDPKSGMSIVRATSPDGAPGHPVLFGSEHFSDLTVLTGDQGARDFLREHKQATKAVILEGSAAVTDLDTPEDWAVWRSKQ